MTRLQAMQFAIMRGAGMVVRTAPAAPATSRPQRRGPTSAGEVIRALRTALAAERKARLDAEARLRRVLEAVARQKSTKVAPRPPPPAVATPALPPAPAEPEVLEPTEVIEPDGSVFARIYEASAGEDDPEEDY